ncbi:MAG: triphosphoribosyl-dephospho-CoA synthase [Sulfolobales archaeon]|nr:triphosphoribosyl-dephospho-CoA synthase [Sulfolobales archaeon]MDW8083270.1 triphosphoribosyl-dephospho-CoA synthase [Sulfolobales archaeon]
MTLQNSRPQSLWRAIAQSFASALVIEVIAPKVSGVTATDNMKDMSSVEFIHTSYYIYDGIERLRRDVGCVSLGKALLDLMRSVLRDSLIRTNTCLGYGLTAISLASTMLYSLRANSCGDVRECVLAGYREFEECLKSENATDLLEAIRLASPSYHGHYYSSEVLVNVFKLLWESALWDLVAYNIVNRYSITLDIYEHVRRVRHRDLVNTVSKLYKSAASKYIDTISFKSGGIMLSRLIQELVSVSTLSDREVRDILVYRVGVNLGSISDIVASSVALALVEWRWRETA